MFMPLNQEINRLNTLIDQIPIQGRPVELMGLSGSDKAFLISKIYHQLRFPILVVAPSIKEAQRFLEDLRFFDHSAGAALVLFPPYNILPFKFLSYHSETAAQRICALYNIIESKTPPIVVTSVDALLQRVIPKQEIIDYAELIVADEEIERNGFIEKLVAGGYQHASIVEEPGDYCVRGGIVDIYGPLYADPIRIEFFGDTVESIRFFSAASQRTIKPIAEAVVLPAREMVLNKALLLQIINRIRARAAELEIPVTEIRKIIDLIENGQGFPGIESLIPLIYPELDNVFDYLPKNTLIVSSGDGDLARAADESEERIAKNFEASCQGKKLCVDPSQLYLSWPQVEAMISQKKPLAFKQLEVQRGVEPNRSDAMQIRTVVETNADLSLQLTNYQDKENLLKPLADWIDEKRRAGLATFIVCRTKTQAERLKSLLTPYGFQFKLTESFSDAKIEANTLCLCLGQISSGFVWAAESLAIITEAEIFGLRPRRRKPSRPRPSSELLDLQDLKKDDLIVHVELGIGRYDGLRKLKVDGFTNDFLVLLYKDGDRLYLPVDRMSIVQKYMGVDGIEPVIDKMGGTSWKRVKARVKRSAEKIAGELLKLYAKRKFDKGYSFGSVDSYFQDFEAGFEYEETPDQIEAIENVLEDMYQKTPMERLICGDVGYGKTEVALRASFLAVNNNKQVAILVPTTILAEQHYATFSKRYERYPINIACLSRFRSVRKQKEIIADLEAGRLDIVIGTHRLLQKDIAFKDLGLLILDEEQRFGVKHKEKLKNLKHNVDVLTLTATPIPRTLHMSLVGIRDISIISTPPEFRQSIITYICEFDGALISEAIRKELSRQGQIFFVHNNIQSITKIARKLQHLVPEVRLDIAHGRMAENDLEQVMYRFLNKEFDMLVCTTIIESGLDIPAANTIIVNRADRFGLAQIYQLRGRVGRADEQAYAYLIIPNESLLTKDAQKRLKVLMEHSDLGSGFQIAMNDLKIRGGGTILGASQSGHIAAVGYDMFLKLMEDAMAELKGEAPLESLEPEINVRMSAFISESYIPDIDQRLAAYRRLAKMTELKEIDDFKTELIDRYGELPKEASNLLFKIVLKILSRKTGVSRLDLTGQQLLLHFSDVHMKNTERLVDMILSAPERYKLMKGHVLSVKLAGYAGGSHLSRAKNILKEIVQRVKN
ncbi:MAG: transcription-repair coupling factor [Desulfobacterales bacterium]|nr:transcription-repair coupling factor [Desulfobacterales bacterium]